MRAGEDAGRMERRGCPETSLSLLLFSGFIHPPGSLSPFLFPYVNHPIPVLPASCFEKGFSEEMCTFCFKHNSVVVPGRGW
jgi:hypothetical protein